MKLNWQNAGIMLVGVAVLGTILTLMLGSDASSSRPKYPTLRFETTSHDFGKIQEGTKVEYVFRFFNDGQDSLRIHRVYGTCSCTASLISNRAIASGAEGQIHVTLDVAKRFGFQEQSVTVLSNDLNNPMVQLTVYADVVEPDH